MRIDHVNLYIASEKPTMARLLFLFTFLASCSLAGAQSPGVVISPAPCAAVYRGVPNRILIASNVGPIDSLIISTSPDHFLDCKNPGNCLLNLSSDPLVQQAQIVVEREKPDGSLELLQKQTFEILDIPDPTIFYAGRSVLINSIPKALLELDSPVAVRIPGFWDISFEVLSFELAVQSRGKSNHFRTKGSKLSPAMKLALHDIEPGSYIIFESCMVELPDGTVRSMPALELTVTP